MNGLIQYLLFHGRFPSLSTLLHISIVHAFFVLSNIPLFYDYTSLFIHSPVDDTYIVSRIFYMINKAAVIICV